jgi:hypothetical protein
VQDVGLGYFFERLDTEFIQSVDFKHFERGFVIFLGIVIQEVVDKFVKLGENDNDRN